MSNRDKQIEQVIENLNCPAGSTLDQRMDELFSKAQAKKQDQPRQRPLQFAAFIRYVAAAIIVIALLVSIFYDRGPNGTGTLYAMTDVSALLREAKTVYIQGWMIVPEPDVPVEQQQKKPFEYWFDSARGRMRFRQTQTSQMGSQAIAIDQEKVINGSYLMMINHMHNNVSYLKMGDFARQYMVRQSFDGLLRQFFLNIQSTGMLEKISTETLDKKEYELWQGTYTLPGPEQTKIEIKVWFDPKTGDIGRMKIWKDSEHEQTVITEITKIIRNVSIPDDLFILQPPEGYTSINTKDQAREISGVMSVGNFHCGPNCLRINIAFQLKDGTVLVCWRGEDATVGTSDPSLFDNLKPGGPLPAFPIIAERLFPLMVDNPPVYQGYHLAHTRRQETDYEWSIYIPNQPISQYPIAFKIMPECSELDDHGKMKPSAMVSTAFVIENQADFQTFVLGAMDLMSDPDRDLPDVTFDSVLELVNQIRQVNNKSD